jgi:amino acid transporter
MFPFINIVDENTSVAVIAASRLVFAIARDGVLPGSWWISRISPDGQPRNAVKIIWVVSASLLCTILPSPVAFTSLVSAAGVPTITAYALIACTLPFITLINKKSVVHSLLQGNLHMQSGVSEDGLVH